MIDRIRIVVLIARPSLVTIFGLFAAVGVAQGGSPRSVSTLTGALIPVIGFVLFSVVINDLADRAIDQINLPGDPRRPLVMRNTADREFLLIGAGAGAIAIAGAAKLGWHAVAVLAAGMALSAAYSLRPVRLADRGAVAALLLPAGYVAVPYLVGILSVRNSLTVADLPLGVALYVGFIGRILLKDFRDVRGDALFGKRTFLVRHGRRATCAFSATCWVAGALLVSALPQHSTALAMAYLTQVAIALLLLSKLASSTSARRDTRLIAAIAVLGRGLVLTVLAHFSVLDAGWSAAYVWALLLSLAAIAIAQAATMTLWGPAVRRSHDLDIVSTPSLVWPVTVSSAVRATGVALTSNEPTSVSLPVPAVSGADASKELSGSSAPVWRLCYRLGQGRPMLFTFGTSPAAMIRSASGRIASTSSAERVPSAATSGAANRSVAASMASRASVPA